MLLKNYFYAFCLVFLGLAIQTQAATNSVPTAYPKIRIATDFQRLSAGSSAWKTYVTTQQVPAAVDYLQGALNVKYPQVNPIKSTATNTCGFATPTALRNGVNADIFVFFNSVNNSNASWITATTLCTLSGGTVRTPIAANIGINTYYMETADMTDPLGHNSNIYIIIHPRHYW